MRNSNRKEIRNPKAKLLNDASIPCTMPRRFTRTSLGIFVLARMSRIELVTRWRSSPPGAHDQALWALPDPDRPLGPQFRSPPALGSRKGIWPRSVIL